MINKLSKKQFVYTLLVYKKTNTKLLRLSPEIIRLIEMINNEKNETAFIHKAIAEYLYRNGLRLIEIDGKNEFRIEAAKPYVKKQCRNCWYIKNW